MMQRPCCLTPTRSGAHGAAPSSLGSDPAAGEVRFTETSPRRRRRDPTPAQYGRPRDGKGFAQAHQGQRVNPLPSTCDFAAGGPPGALDLFWMERSVSPGPQGPAAKTAHPPFAGHWHVPPRQGRHDTTRTRSRHCPSRPRARARQPATEPEGRGGGKEKVTSRCGQSVAASSCSLSTNVREAN